MGVNPGFGVGPVWAENTLFIREGTRKVAENTLFFREGTRKVAENTLFFREGTRRARRRGIQQGTHKGCPYGGTAQWKEISTEPHVIWRDAVQAPGLASWWSPSVGAGASSGTGPAHTGI